MECRWPAGSYFHVRVGVGVGAGGAGGVPIKVVQKRDHPLAIQSSKIFHCLGSELVPVVSRDVQFNFIRASPLELAERAFAPRPVFFLLVTLQLLDSFELFPAIRARKFLHTVEHDLVGE